MQPDLRLIGGQQIGTETDVVPFYMELFGRLPLEVERATIQQATIEQAPAGQALAGQAPAGQTAGGQTSDMGRYIGFEAALGRGRSVRFLGIAVNALHRIPPGRVGWELTADLWRVLQPGEHGPVVAWQAPPQWRWLTSGSQQAGPILGEFTALVPPDWPEGAAPTEPRKFRMTAHAFLSIRGRKPPDEVRLADPDPAWPGQFADMAEWLREQLGPLARRIEHFGSTAIPGLPAKPVVDILVEVPSFDSARQHILPRVNRPDWEYWWYCDHMLLIKRADFAGVRTHHVHVAPPGHRLWRGLAFRDYLRTHPNCAREYAAHKQHLAQTHRDDREAYTEAKTAFIDRITKLALGE